MNLKKRILKYNLEIVQAVLKFDEKLFVLNENHSTLELQNFLNDIDFEVCSYFGEQLLFGTVWFEDSSWLSVEEHDGAEYFVHHVRPTFQNKIDEFAM